MLLSFVWIGSQWLRDLKKSSLLVAQMAVSSLLERLEELKRASLRLTSPPLSPSSGVMRALLWPLLEKMDLLKFGQEVVCSDLNSSNAINQFMV